MALPRAETYPWWCQASPTAGDAEVVAEAERLIRNIYRFPPFKAVTLPSDLSWKEDPFDDRAWQLRLQILGFVGSLVEAWHITGHTAYADRAAELLLDWIADNPRSDPPSEFSWSDHGVALRATVLTCAADILDMGADLRSTMDTHGRLLADPDFYKGYGNHALDQSIGLLDIGIALSRQDWKDLAARRINDLLEVSVDAYGVTNEQSIEYQSVNYQRYVVARRRLSEAGLTPSTLFERVDRMPAFLAHATLPNGQYELLGDTDMQRAPVLWGTVAEFTATKGASGTRPSGTIAHYPAGFLFARSGWGDERPYEDETHLSVRYGPARFMHGHDDHGAVTLYGYGTRLLWDRGKYTYDHDRWRDYFVSRAAHNVVTVDGVAWDKRKATTLVSSSIQSRVVDVRVKATGYPGVTMRRRITYSRRLDWVVVEDRIEATSTKTFRQLWHLAPDAGPRFGTSGILTSRAHGNVVIRQLAGDPTSRIVTGATSPIQGWQAKDFAQRVPAPTIEVRQRGRVVRYLTLIVPGSTNPKVGVSGLRTLSDGYEMTITVNGQAEHIRVNGTSVSISTP